MGLIAATIEVRARYADLLLAVVAPAPARFKSGDTSPIFNVLARSILGEKSIIFGLIVEGEKLVVSIESKILNVRGFPVAHGKDYDVLKSISVVLFQYITWQSSGPAQKAAQAAHFYVLSVRFPIRPTSVMGTSGYRQKCQAVIRADFMVYDR